MKFFFTINTRTQSGHRHELCQCVNLCVKYQFQEES
jgi:hypothetical protein